MRLIVMRLTMMLVSSINVDIIVDFSIDVQPILLISIDWSKIDICNIIGFSITIIAGITVVTWSMFLWSMVMIWFMW